MAAVGVKLQRLNQGSSHEDASPDVGHTEIEPQAMAAEQGDSQHGMGATEEQETEPQAIETDDQQGVGPINEGIEANQHETYVNEVSPFPLTRV